MITLLLKTTPDTANRVVLMHRNQYPYSFSLYIMLHSHCLNNNKLLPNNKSDRKCIEQDPADNQSGK